MSYKPNDLRVITQQNLQEEKEEEFACPWDEQPTTFEGHTYDSRGDSVAPPIFALPHSCDGWIIGGVEEAKLLIRELADAVRSVEEGR